MDAILTPGDFDGNGTVELAARDRGGHCIWSGDEAIGQRWQIFTAVS
jgi:hypothetical protein